MRIDLTLMLNCSLEHAWQIFDDPANLPRWQPSLVRVETLSGTPGHVGARTQLTYRESGRDITLVETVEERNPPATYRCRYESALMNSSICNTFTSQSSNVTIWHVVQETRFHGLLRLIGPLTLPITVRKFRHDMARLKTLAEQGLGTDAAPEVTL